MAQTIVWCYAEKQIFSYKEIRVTPIRNHIKRLAYVGR